MEVENAKKLKVLFVAAELAPYSKVGGLGEVAAGLTRALSALDVDVRILTPLHGSMRATIGKTVTVAKSVPFEFAGENRPFNLLSVIDSDRPAPVFLLESPDFFELESDPYGQVKGPSGHGDLRWLYFSKAVRPACQRAGFSPQVLHVNDWHAALVPALYRSEHYFDEEAAQTACVLTIHNAHFQGKISIADYLRAGLRNDLLSDWYLLQNSDVNLLKAGALFAERITTVSESYAQEITKEQGAGLESVFESRMLDLVGIPNGLDPKIWNPETDPLIPDNYSAKNVDGKKTCRDALLTQMNLEESPGPRHRHRQPADLAEGH